MILNLSAREARALRDWMTSYGIEDNPVRDKLERLLDNARVYDVSPEQTTVYDHLEAA